MSPSCPPISAGSPLECSLNQVRVGSSVRIRQLRTDPGTSQRLRELGVGENQVLQLISKSASLICRVCNARLALSEQIASLIRVEPVGLC